MLDSEGRWLNDPAYDIVIDDCPVCRRVAATDAEMRDRDLPAHAGKRVVLAAHGPAVAPAASDPDTGS